MGVKGRGDAHARILSCLTEPNQAWARNAPVLAVGVVMRQFTANGKPNKAAEHDLGLASANLVMEATVRGLRVHQMIGVDREAVRTAFSIPPEAEALTALAIGHLDASQHSNPALRERDAKPRARRPIGEFVFGDQFGEAADL